MSFMAGLFGGGMNYDPYGGKLSQTVEEQQRFVNALNAQTPEAIAAQRQLLTNLQSQAAGTGPSAAQAMLNRATAQGTAGTAAALAGQRGAGANVGLLGRNVATIAGQQQQDLASQAAMMRAQEQLSAQSQLAGLTGQQLGQVQSGLGQEAGAAGNLEQLKTQTELQKARTQQGILGNVLGAVGTAVGGPLLGAIGSGVSNLFQKKGPAGSNISDYKNLAGGGYVDQFQSGMMGMAHGGKVPAMVSPGEKYLPPSEVKKVVAGKKPVTKAGETIPGKAKVAGDSLKNDTVKKTLTEGGIVIPRTVMQSKNPEDSARRFVAAVMAKKSHKRK